ncbi:hypothetical protein QVD17_11810 [Tagetes erecta]|uniref:Uncharacterized protein n=1 Tax=Tagetes erecta TaxID=13708 RepID=A0AAD8KYN4_TARER|nr:hypothetical protein QVD17_11810 [Tagetes erecta]
MMKLVLNYLNWSNSVQFWQPQILCDLNNQAALSSPTHSLIDHSAPLHFLLKELLLLVLDLMIWGLGF